MIKRLIFISLFSVLLLVACSNEGQLSGEVFDVRVVGDPMSPGSFQTIATLEFGDDNRFKNTKGNEEGTYDLSGDKLVILLEDENEKLKIEFKLEESDKELNEYEAELIHADYQMEESEKVSKYNTFYQKVYGADFYVMLAKK